MNNKEEEFDSEFVDIEDILNDLFVALNYSKACNISLEDYNILYQASLILHRSNF